MEEPRSKRLKMNSGEAPSLSTSHGCHYEVFLSFRGEDTRTGFTDHLYTSLVDAAIRTFRDNEGLHVGEQIGPQLLTIIESSKICIPIFSKNYASSKWCLIELTQMIKCRAKHSGQMIMPVFYDVPPGVVKNQTESFGEAFLKHETNFDTKTVQEWKEALREVGNLKGWEKEKIHDGHEAKLVREIVSEVCIKLNKISVDIPEELVGMNNHVEEMLRILDIGSGGVRMIGIRGMGGIGKTTIAKFMYKQLSQHFQPYCSFIEDIREEATKHKDLVHLQNRLLHDLKEKDVEIKTAGQGKRLIEAKFQSKKVLIVLDDVDRQSQLLAVAGKTSWFGPGSRIIVTTRDNAVLTAHEVCEIYQPKEMSLDLSLRLFSLHAFKKSHPPRDFYDISEDIVGIGGGLPLFFEVIGSLLAGYVDNKPFWESTSAKLKNIPNVDVQNKLKISYDTLDDAQKAIFVDIACHFIGESKSYCVYMWDACGFFGENGLGVLLSRSLVKIGEGDEFLMHDLVRDLGRDIVRRENTNPEKRSRLWSVEDAEETLIECKGTKNIQTLALNEPSRNSRTTVPGEAFMTLSNLRYLQMKRAKLTGSFKGPLSKLRWLSLKDVSWTPPIWCPKKLVVLDLYDVDIIDEVQFWNQIQMSTNLKVLQIQECGKLTRTPDFSSFPNLEIIYLRRCPHLVEISGSIKLLSRLTLLGIVQCQSVLELPKDFGSMSALRELILDGTSIKEICVHKGSMKKLQKLSAKRCLSLTQISSIVHLHSLQHLSFDHCESLSEIPDSIGLLVELQHLSFDGCKSLVDLPDSMGSLVNLQHISFKKCKSLVKLPDSICWPVNLKHLPFEHCTSLVKVPTSIGSLVNLQYLSFDNFESLVELPESMGSLVNLQYLSFFRCASLVKLPDSMGSRVNLQYLSFFRCASLVELPDSMGSLVNLQDLSLKGCASLVELPDSMCSLVKLRYLSLNGCASLVELPDSMGSLVNLQDLSLKGCASLVELPDSMGSLVNLQDLSLKGCASLVELPDSMCSLVKLRYLSLNGCASLVELPDSMGSLVNLQDLSLKGCASLVELPDSMGSLVNLQHLSFYGCASLVKLPDSMGSLVNLQHLSFYGCASLVELPDSIGSLVNLQHLSFYGCASLVKVPDSMGSLVNLQHLSFYGCASLVELPDSIGSLVNLQHLPFYGCASLVKLPDSMGSLVNLKHLLFNGCKSLVELPDSMGSLVKLRYLSLGGCEPSLKVPSSIRGLPNCLIYY